MKYTNSKFSARSSGIIKLSLSSKDMVLLKKYAESNNMTTKTAAKKILKEFLVSNVSFPEEVSHNQLDLFSSRETDLFDYTR